MRSYVLMWKYFASYSTTGSCKHFSDYRQCIISETYLFSKKWKSIFKHSVKVFRDSHLFEGLFLSVFFIVSNERRIKWYNIFVVTTSSTLILKIDEYFWMTAAHNKVIQDPKSLEFRSLFIYLRMNNDDFLPNRCS